MANNRGRRVDPRRLTTGVVTLRLPPEICESFRTFAAESGVPMNQALLAAVELMTHQQASGVEAENREAVRDQMIETAKLEGWL